MKKIGVANYLIMHQHKGGIVAIPSAKLLYMKSCKTAGTSIYRGVLKNNFPDVLNIKDTPSDFNEWLRKLDDTILSEYTIFSIVRNPYDRLMSAAAHFNINIDELCSNFEELSLDKKIKLHTLPCHYYTHINGIQFVDEIIRFENLDQEMEKFFFRIGLHGIKLPHLNKTNHPKYRESYSQQSIDFVNIKYAEDISLYGYKF